MALLESSFKSGDELAAKDATEYAHWKEEGIAGMDPTGVIGGKTSGGNHTMQVRMMEQVLAPGVEHDEKADLGAQVLGISGDGEQSFRRGPEQDAIELSLILIGNCRNRLR